MSFWGQMFGKKGSKGPTPQEAIQRLRETEEILQKKSDFLEKKIEQEIIEAKKNGTKNKRGAIQALKRKKRYEKQLNQIDGTLSTIEFQREALENASTNTEVLNVMGDAAIALQASHKNMNVEDVHKLMDDVAEQNEIANEISTAISNPVGFGDDVDEDDLMAELEELEQEALDEELVKVGPAYDHLPSVPDQPLTDPVAAKSSAKASNDDNDVRELEMWAS